MHNHTISSVARKLVVSVLPSVVVLVLLGSVRIVGASNSLSAAATPTAIAQAQGACTAAAQPTSTEPPLRSGHPH